MACVIKTCKSRTERQQKNYNEEISFHRFPCDVNLKKKWIAALSYPNGWTPKKNNRICSKHFTKECFTSNCKFRRLTENAVPSLHINSMKQATMKMAPVPYKATVKMAPMPCPRVTTVDPKCSDLPMNAEIQPTVVPGSLMATMKIAPVPYKATVKMAPMPYKATMKLAPMPCPRVTTVDPKCSDLPTKADIKTTAVPGTLVPTLVLTPLVRRTVTTVDPKFSGIPKNAGIKRGSLVTMPATSPVPMVCRRAPTFNPKSSARPINCAEHLGRIDRLEKRVSMLEKLAKKRLKKINCLKQRARRLTVKNMLINMKLMEEKQNFVDVGLFTEE